MATSYFDSAKSRFASSSLNDGIYAQPGSPGPLSKDYYGGSAGAGYRRQQEAYTRALRQLRHASRRGDTGAALQEIRVRDEAMDRGYEGGFIRDRAGSQAGIMGKIAAKEQALRDRQAAEAAERSRSTEAGMEGEPETLETPNLVEKRFQSPLEDRRMDSGDDRFREPAWKQYQEPAWKQYQEPAENRFNGTDTAGVGRSGWGTPIGSNRTYGTKLSTTYGKAGRGTPVASRSLLTQRRGLV